MSEKPGWLIGSQDPTLKSIPTGDRAFAENACAFVRWAGLDLYPWQEDLLRDALMRDEKGLWSAREVVVSVARQNGKGEFLVALELVAIYLCGAEKIMHSAHFLDTAMDARDRLWEVIEAHDGLMSWWEDEFPGQRPRPVLGNGKDAVKFPGGAKIYYRTRTKKTGRGLSFDWLIFDECFDLPGEVYAAMNNTTKARPNSQTVFISSPVNVMEHMHGAIFSAKRWAGVDKTPGILFKEWSLRPGEDPFDPSAWVHTNPSLVSKPKPGVQLAAVQSEAASAKKSEALRSSFMVETLGTGHWVPRDGEVGDDFRAVVDMDTWREGTVDRPVAVGDVALGVEVSPEGERVAVVAAGRTPAGMHLMARPDEGGFSVEETVAMIRRFVDAYHPVAVVLDRASPAGVLVPALQQVGIDPVGLTGAQVSAAWRTFAQAVGDATVTNDGAAVWEKQLGCAKLRDEFGKYPALNRFSGEISELVAATFAAHSLTGWVADSSAGARAVGETRQMNPPGTFAKFKVRSPHGRRGRGGVLVA